MIYGPTPPGKVKAFNVHSQYSVNPIPFQAKTHASPFLAIAAAAGS